MLYDQESIALKTTRHSDLYKQTLSMRIDNLHPNTPRPIQMRQT